MSIMARISDEDTGKYHKTCKNSICHFQAIYWQSYLSFEKKGDKKRTHHFKGLILGKIVLMVILFFIPMIYIESNRNNDYQAY